MFFYNVVCIIFKPGSCEFNLGNQRWLQFNYSCHFKKTLTYIYDHFIRLLAVCNEFNDLSYLIITARAYSPHFHSSPRHFNLVTFAKFEPLERFKLTQLFVYHVHDTNVTHCVDGKQWPCRRNKHTKNNEKI